MKLSQNQVEVLLDFIIQQPNTQTPLAIIAKAILEINTENESKL